MHDVLVAGSGPAGALAACLLARRGVSVTMVDRARFPRPKLCGDTINPGAVSLLERHFDLAPVAASACAIRGMLLSGPGGVSVRGEYGAGRQGLGVARDVLDAWLVEQALHAGAKLVDGTTVTGPQLAADGRVVGLRTRSSAGVGGTMSAVLTLAADGQHSTIGRALRLTHAARRPRRWAVGAYFDGVRGLSDVGEMHVRAGRYIGVAPTADGRANACLVQAPVRGQRWGRPEALLWSAIHGDPDLAPRFASARLATRPVVLGPLAVETPVPGRPGLLLVGDAAGFIDPMTGDGIHLALQGAEVAAEAVAAALAGPSPAAAHGPYTRALAARLGSKRRFDRTLRAVVASPAAVRLAAGSARFWPTAFQSIIRMAGDLPLRAS